MKTPFVVNFYINSVTGETERNGIIDFAEIKCIRQSLSGKAGCEISFGHSFHEIVESYEDMISAHYKISRPAKV